MAADTYNGAQIRINNATALTTKLTIRASNVCPKLIVKKTSTLLYKGVNPFSILMHMKEIEAWYKFKRSGFLPSMLNSYSY